MAGQGLSQRGWAAGEAGPKPCWPRADATRKLESAPRALDRRRARASRRDASSRGARSAGRCPHLSRSTPATRPPSQPQRSRSRPQPAARPPTTQSQPARPDATEPPGPGPLHREALPRAPRDPQRPPTQLARARSGRTPRVSKSCLWDGRGPRRCRASKLRSSYMKSYYAQLP